MHSSNITEEYFELSQIIITYYTVDMKGVDIWTVREDINKSNERISEDESIWKDILENEENVGNEQKNEQSDIVNKENQNKLITAGPSIANAVSFVSGMYIAQMLPGIF